MKFSISPKAIIPVHRQFTGAHNKVAVAKMKKRDRVADEYDLIYQTPEKSLLATANTFFTFSMSTGVSMLGISAYKYFYECDAEFLQEFDSHILQQYGIAGIVVLSAVLSYLCRSTPFRFYKKDTE